MLIPPEERDLTRWTSSLWRRHCFQIRNTSDRISNVYTRFSCSITAHTMVLNSKVPRRHISPCSNARSGIVQPWHYVALILLKKKKKFDEAVSVIPRFVWCVSSVSQVEEETSDSIRISDDSERWRNEYFRCHVDGRKRSKEKGGQLDDVISCSTLEYSDFTGEKKKIFSFGVTATFLLSSVFEYLWEIF